LGATRESLDASGAARRDAASLQAVNARSASAVNVAKVGDRMLFLRDGYTLRGGDPSWSPADTVDHIRDGQFVLHGNTIGNPSYAGRTCQISRGDAR
jgi:hypothetical protein